MPLESKYSIENLFGSKIRVRILKILARKEELPITSIINTTRTNYNTALKHLRFLEACNLIQEHKFGRIRMFRYKRENIKARTCSQLIEIWEGRAKEEKILLKL